MKDIIECFRTPSSPTSSFADAEDAGELDEDTEYTTMSLFARTTSSGNSDWPGLCVVKVPKLNRGM